MNSQSLADRLSAFPNLARVLGEAWVREQETIAPEDSDFRLARWLRRTSTSAMLDRIDANLGVLLNRNERGSSSTFRALRRDPDAFLERMTEVYFAAWLSEKGIKFEMPESGPDFKVELGDGTVLNIEAITPRKTDWLDDLFDALTSLAISEGWEAEIRYKGELLTSDKALRCSEVIATAKKCLDEAGETEEVTQDYPEIGYTITWTRSPARGASQMSTQGFASLRTGLDLIYDAANKKVRQLPQGEQNVLLYGPSQSGDEMQVLASELQRLVQSEQSILEVADEQYWTDFPARVTYVCLYEYSLDSGKPFRVTWIPNPKSEVIQTDAAHEFACRITNVED